MTKHLFFEDEGFEFATLTALGGAAYRITEVGEVLSTVRRITNADCDSWFNEWTKTAERVEQHARGASEHGHFETARDAFLRASSYRSAALFYVLGTNDPSRELACFQQQRADVDAAFARWPTPVDQVRIPYEATTLAGYWFSGGEGTRPLVIFTNGSDGTVSDILLLGVSDAVARGWHALVYDGPGQGEALYVDKIPFRYDWEVVITPIIDWALARGDVDPARIAQYGWSQAGYWVPRSAAFEHRLAAIAADPGVVNVQTSWTAHLPEFMMNLYREGKREDFDQCMVVGEQQDPMINLTMKKRCEPYMTDSIFDVLTELDRWNLTDVAGQITCPVLITAPDHERFWPGQSQQLADLITAPTKLVHFRTEDGADWHCEPMTPVVRSHTVLDWIGEQFA